MNLDMHARWLGRQAVSEVGQKEPAGVVPYADIGLVELRHDVIRTMLVALFVSGIFALAVVANDPIRWKFAHLPVIICLSATAGATLFLARRGVTQAAVALLAGIFLTVLVASYAFHDGLLVLLLPAVAIVAGVLLGWRYAPILGATSIGVVVLIARGSPDLVTSEILDMSYLLTAVDLLLSWILSRPVLTALTWSWASYTQAVEKAEQARDRQAELAGLSKSLEDACVRLENANDELDRARRAAVEARRLKLEFATAISHELRTPLNLIIGFSEMLMLARRGDGTDELSTAVQGDVEAIHRNACHLSSLIDDVLELAQIEVHRLGFKREPCALRPIVDEALGSVEILVRDHGLDLAIDLPGDLPILNVDRTRIRQVLINLVVNAARYTKTGGIRISATSRDADVVVTVSDSGVGIPQAELATIFEEFHQVEGADRVHHNGLGLAICKRLIELHGGTIWADSEIGYGTTFSFSLPRCENVITSLPDEWQTWAVVVGQTSPAILVLGSDPQVARLLGRYLDRYHVVAAFDAAQASRLARQWHPRALVAVGKEGECQLAHVQEFDDALRGLPAFRCALRSHQSVERELATVSYLIKPVTLDQLKHTLAKLGRRPRNLLVIDDDREILRLLPRMIHAIYPRCRVRVTPDGTYGLAAMHEIRPDVVLLDLLMPDLDGYGVLRAMREAESLRDIPVVVVSAHGAEEDAVVAEELSLSRLGGLSLTELVACLEENLNVLIDGARTAPKPPEVTLASPVW